MAAIYLVSFNATDERSRSITRRGCREREREIAARVRYVDAFGECTTPYIYTRADVIFFKIVPISGCTRVSAPSASNSDVDNGSVFSKLKTRTNTTACAWRRRFRSVLLVNYARLIVQSNSRLQRVRDCPHSSPSAGLVCFINVLITTVLFEES